LKTVKEIRNYYQEFYVSFHSHQILNIVDYDAPLSEAGDITPKFLRAREIILEKVLKPEGKYVSNIYCFEKVKLESVGHDIVVMSTFHSLMRHRGRHDGCRMLSRICLPFRST